MFDTLRKCATLVGSGMRGRWALVIVLALAVSVVEAAGGLVVYALLTRITTEASGFELPVLGDLHDVAPGLNDTQLLALIGTGIALFFLIRAAIILAQAYVQHRVAENAGARLATHLVAGYLAMPYVQFVQRNSAELIRNSYDNVQHFVREGLVPAVKLLSHLAIVVALVLVLLATSPLAAVFAVLFLGPLAVVMLRVVQPRVKRLGATAQSMAKTSIKSVNEGLGGWRDIRVLGRSAYFVERFDEARRRLARARYLKSTAREVPRIVLETGLILFVLAFLGFSVLIEGGALEALPTLGLFGYAAIRVQPSINEVLFALNSLKFVGPGIDAIHEDLQLAREHGLQVRSTEAWPLTRELRLEQVAFRYPNTQVHALEGINLTIGAGESIGIIGPTGGGKSTLIDLILGLLEPTTGRVTVDGQDLQEDVPGWHRSIGLVPQMIFLADDTLRRNIALGVPDEDIDEERIQEAVAMAQLTGFVASLPEGLDTEVGERGVRVSGGQRQRLAIARALYWKPSVLIFDEGTSALDNRTEAELLEAIERLRGERTIITVAHRLTTVEQANRVVMIEDGRIADVGPYAELATRHAGLRTHAS
jgi:ATP-binding cassette, subfamily B, bacterial PglK